MVTYSDLIQFVVMLCAVVTLVIDININAGVYRCPSPVFFRLNKEM